MAEHIKKRKDKSSTPEYRKNYDKTFRNKKDDPLPKDIREPAHYMECSRRPRSKLAGFGPTRMIDTLKVTRRSPF